MKFDKPIQRKIIKDAYKYAKNYKEFNILPENEFIELFFSSNINVKLDDYSVQLLSDFLEERTTFEKMLIEETNNNINLILIRMIYLFNENPEQLYFIYNNLDISRKYGLIYFFKAYYFLIQKERLNSIYKLDSFFEEQYFEEYIYKVFNDKNLIEILGEDYFKYFFLNYFDKYIERNKFSSNNTGLEKILILFMQTFNTYKWLNKRRKKKLTILAKRSIYYAEYAKYLESIGKNEYLSEMTYKLMNDECIVV